MSFFSLRETALIFQRRNTPTYPPLCFGSHDMGQKGIQNAANIRKRASEERKRKSTSLGTIFKFSLIDHY